MSEKPKENLINEATGASEKEKRFGFELPAVETGETIEAISALDSLVVHDRPVTEADINQISTSLENLSADLNLEVNAKIWKEIGDGYSGSCEELTYITPKVMEKLVDGINERTTQGPYYRRDTSLNKLSTLNVEVAEKLKKIWTGVCLDGLKDISPEVAKELAQIKPKWLGHLTLNGLEDISLESAESLKGFPCCIELKGVSRISPEVAEQLGQKRDHLELGITEISPEVAHALADNEGGSVFLNELQEISPDVAEQFKKSRRDYFYLDGVSSVSLAVAKHLSECVCRIHLNGVREVSPEVADLLSRNKSIEFEGLENVSEEVIDVLLANASIVSFGGMRSISDNIAECIGRHEGANVFLRNLEYISGKGVESLCKCGGSIILGIKHLSDSSAEILSKNKKWVQLYKLGSLSDEAAEYFSHFDGDELGFNSGIVMSDASREKLRANKKIKFINFI